MNEINKVVIFTSMKSVPNKLLGFVVNGDISLIVTLTEGDTYREILLSHGVELSGDTPNMAGKTHNVRDVDAFIHDCREFFVNMGFECTDIDVRSTEEWQKEFDE